MFQKKFNKLSWQRIVASPESYTSNSGIDDETFCDLSQNHWEDKNLPFLKDEYLGEDEVPLKFILDPNANGNTKLDKPTNPAYNGIIANLRLSWIIDTADDLRNKKYYSLLRISFKDFKKITPFFNNISIEKPSSNNSWVTYFQGYWKDLVFEFIKGDYGIDVYVDNFEFYDKFNKLIHDIRLSKNSFTIFQNLLKENQSILVNKQSSLKFSSDLPNAEEIVQYDFAPETQLNQYPSKRKDNWDYKKRNTKGDEETIFEKGLHQDMNRAETGRDLIPYASKLSYQNGNVESFSSQNSLFIYIKPDDKVPLKIDNAHTTLVYCKNSVEESSRQKVIEDISKLLKDYEKPECSFGGTAIFDNDDKSRVILINFENGAELYSRVIEVLSKYIEISKDYDFIPHMTINKTLDIDELPEYKWKPNCIYIEFEKDVPAIEIEFKTGKIKEVQNLDETLKDNLNKLTWKENPVFQIKDSKKGDVWKVRDLSDNIEYYYLFLYLPSEDRFNIYFYGYIGKSYQEVNEDFFSGMRPFKCHVSTYDSDIEYVSNALENQNLSKLTWQEPLLPNEDTTQSIFNKLTDQMKEDNSQNKWIAEAQSYLTILPLNVEQVIKLKSMLKPAEIDYDGLGFVYFFLATRGTPFEEVKDIIGVQNDGEFETIAAGLDLDYYNIENILNKNI